MKDPFFFLFVTDLSLVFLVDPMDHVIDIRVGGFRGIIPQELHPAEVGEHPSSE